jgi:hypothetical protein
MQYLLLEAGMMPHGTRAAELRAIFGEATADRALLVIDASTGLPQLESTRAATLPAEGRREVRILRAVGAARTMAALRAIKR